MAKTAEAKAPTKEVAATTETPTTNVAVNGKTISHEDAAKALANAERGEQDSGYLPFTTPGEKKRVIFLGLREINSLDPKKKAQGEKINAVVFSCEGKEKINADVAIRSYFEKFKGEEGKIAREIVFKGMTTGPNGDYKTFEFYELNVKA